jgi:hypothetical protein
VARTHLPREAQHVPLDYERLIATLDALEGESVVVRLSRGELRQDSGAASIVGELRHQLPGRFEGHEFSIGSPYPDRYPDHLAGGILFIDSATFTSATLSTFDGNDHFIVSIRTHALDILVQDVTSTYP